MPWSSIGLISTCSCSFFLGGGGAVRLSNGHLILMAIMSYCTRLVRQRDPLLGQRYQESCQWILLCGIQRSLHRINERLQHRYKQSQGDGQTRVDLCRCCQSRMTAVKMGGLPLCDTPFCRLEDFHRHCRKYNPGILATTTKW